MPKSKTSLRQLLYEVRRIEKSREKLTEQKIKAMYETLLKDLKSFVADNYEKYADPDGRLFLAYLDAHNKRAKFLQEIAENVSGISLDVQEEIETLVDITYRKSYKGMSDALLQLDTMEKFEAATKDLSVNPYTLKKAVNNNISKLTLPPVLERYRSETIYQIQQELNNGLMLGDRYEKMAKRITERVGVSESKAMNIVRTETHRNIESGFMECAENLDKKLEGSDLIYAATWRTMKDERVRPLQRRKTKHGWKTVVSKRAANHQKMEGQTIKVGELFDLGDGVKAKAPGESGVAAHDCNCRCFIEYNLMTVEEFAKATGQTEEQVRKKYKIDDIRENEPAVKENTLTESEKSDKMVSPKNVQLQLSDYPSEFTKGAEGKNTQKLIDYINGVKGADPNVLKLYASTGKLENISSNGITFKISHAQSHSVQTTSSGITGELKEVKYTIPKLKGDNISGQVNTTLHEQMHLLDLYGREDVTRYDRWFSTTQQSLVDAFKNSTDEMSDEIAELFTKHNNEYFAIRDRVKAVYKKKIDDAKEKHMQGKSPWEDFAAYKAYEKEAKKLQKEMVAEIDYQARNIMGGGVNNLQDIYDALSAGTHRANGVVIFGHGQQYYSRVSSRIKETVANYASLSVTRPDLIDMLRKDKPELCEELNKLVIELAKKVGD